MLCRTRKYEFFVLFFCIKKSKNEKIKTVMELSKKIKFFLLTVLLLLALAVRMFVLSDKEKERYPEIRFVKETTDNAENRI